MSDSSRSQRIREERSPRQGGAARARPLRTRGSAAGRSCLAQAGMRPALHPPGHARLLGKSPRLLLKAPVAGGHPDNGRATPVPPAGHSPTGRRVGPTRRALISSRLRRQRHRDYPRPDAWAPARPARSSAARSPASASGCVRRAKGATTIVKQTRTVIGQNPKFSWSERSDRVERPP